ncbi:hypothetical protein HRW23_31990 [Streptomyces lunaelactis]|uniref:hypothetical protein n=1 Tax=Streptomyces lunaelactis TaxID=1535768 RepID=UPI0015856F91|nr:hypothetical protein [Streptomyces lunaelactis]NUK02357.1 hypothetical protein [Streptomyces lunaelactis]NUK09148.1 hypothetical protein [Streptomyces lunaelactis]NUK16156.1 hypothetical protein [Streptomyces lunaelactis]NUK23560.1 hypothetical protein [Streptomyces lunaelactis]NUK34030.1 hypothetical protein [Streptomyces lunaelactis]
MPTSRLLWWGGLVAAACGAVLCVIGWYGVSGERFTARQLPYLASSTVPGAALLVAGAVLIAAAGRHGGPPAPDEPSAAGDAAAEEVPPWDAPSSDGPQLCVPGGTLAHRPDCPLVAGKPEAVPVGDRELGPCPVCEPRI